ncbi:hypothetical protein WMF27_07935 [Sorangium sp. So ce281]|uniref:hypothetical protein n=1 Tax=unclassified Sorangium TaxID=2621164 RepID=UPI003F5F77DE
MKSTLVAMILGALSLSTVMSSSGPARAQHGDRDHAPRGSYLRTCRNIRMDRGTLYARCEDRRGNWHPTRLVDARRCRGDIENRNGQLRCDRGR